MNGPAWPDATRVAAGNVDRWLLRRFGDDAHLHLIALRICVCALLLLGGDLGQAVPWAAASPALWRPPPGAEWLAVVASALGHDGARALLWLTRALLLLAAFGIGGGLALGLSAFGCVVLLGLPQLSGTVRHSHHLVWLLLLLALAGRPRPGLGAARALAGIWGLFACVYVFPGLHKLLNVGADWATGDLVLRHARWKWLQVGRVPALAAWLPPWAFTVGGAAVLLLELGWPLLALSRRAAPVLLLATVAFHQAAAALLFITFPSLWLPLMTLLPWPAWSRALRGWPAAQSADTPRSPPASPMAGRVRLGLGLLLLGAVEVQGARGQTEAWPFACYPHFAVQAAAEMPALRVRWTAVDGTPQVETPRPLDGDRQRLWGQIWSLALDRDSERRCRRQRAWLQDWLCAQPNARSDGPCRPGARIEVERVWLSTDPATAGRVVRAEASCSFEGLRAAGGNGAAAGERPKDALPSPRRPSLPPDPAGHRPRPWSPADAHAPPASDQAQAPARRLGRQCRARRGRPAGL